MTTLTPDRTDPSAPEQADAVHAADRPLVAFDRCDACGAQAYVRVAFADHELLFCGHHAKRHEAKLRPMAQVWHDESARLLGR